MPISPWPNALLIYYISSRSWAQSSPSIWWHCLFRHFGQVNTSSCVGDSLGKALFTFPMCKSRVLKGVWCGRTSLQVHQRPLRWSRFWTEAFVDMDYWSSHVLVPRTLQQFSGIFKMLNVKISWVFFGLLRVPDRLLANDRLPRSRAQQPLERHRLHPWRKNTDDIFHISFRPVGVEKMQFKIWERILGLI